MSAWDTRVNSNLSNAPYKDNPKWFDFIMNPEIGVPAKADDQATLNFDIISFDHLDGINSWVYLNEVYMEEVTITP